MKLEEMQELNRRLTALLADPQPGLILWCEALGETMRSLVSGWTGVSNSREMKLIAFALQFLKSNLDSEIEDSIGESDGALSIEKELELLHEKMNRNLQTAS